MSFQQSKFSMFGFLVAALSLSACAINLGDSGPAPAPAPLASATPTPTPIIPPPPPAPFSVDFDLDSGDFHNCALFTDGALKCWGGNFLGQLGLGDMDTRGDSVGETAALTPVDLGPGAQVKSMAVGGYHSCMILRTGGLKCFGYNDFGQLGLEHGITLGDQPGEMGQYLLEVNLGTGRTAATIAAGTYHNCAILDNGALKCWGHNGGGQLGLGDSFNRGLNPGEMGDYLPSVFLGTSRSAVAVALGQYHTCALLDDGNVKCWGDNTFGQLGQGHTAPIGLMAGDMSTLLPVQLGTGRSAIAIAAGGSTSCALLDNYTLKCWGMNINGQLGQGSTTSVGDAAGEMGNFLAIINLGTGRTARSVSVGIAHACASLDDGSLKCWGANASGQLGQGDMADRGDDPGEMSTVLPIALGTGLQPSKISLGFVHSCTILNASIVKCWGDNSLGQLGLGDLFNRGDAPAEMGNNLAEVEL